MPRDPHACKIRRNDMLFFRLSSLELGLLFFGALLGATVLGVVLGRRGRLHSGHLKEPCPASLPVRGSQ